MPANAIANNNSVILNLSQVMMLYLINRQLYPRLEEHNGFNVFQSLLTNTGFRLHIREISYHRFLYQVK